MITTPARFTYITPNGLSKLEEELDHLKTTRRHEIAEFLQETNGDTEESEYLIALEEQSFVEGRIQQIETILCNVHIIQPGQSNTGIVAIGSTVLIQEEGLEPETFMVVGGAEANPRKGMISNESPLGRAMLEHQVGETIEVRAPDGLTRFRILAVL